MKKIIVIALYSFVFIGCGNSSNQELSTDVINNPGVEESAKKELPIFEFEKEVEDFGKITQGEIVEKTFRFKNVGKSNLLISSAHGSCGCTVAEYPEKPIAPGEEAEIKVKFDSNGKQGRQQKTVTLVANTVPNTKVLTLKGEVIVPGE
jgi:hypothetical protein